MSNWSNASAPRSCSTDDGAWVLSLATEWVRLAASLATTMFWIWGAVLAKTRKFRQLLAVLFQHERTSALNYSCRGWLSTLRLWEYSNKIDVTAGWLCLGHLSPAPQAAWTRHFEAPAARMRGVELRSSGHGPVTVELSLRVSLCVCVCVWMAGCLVLPCCVTPHSHLSQSPNLSVLREAMRFQVRARGVYHTLSLYHQACELLALKCTQSGACRMVL